MNYKESTISGTQWTRCRAVTITNPVAGTMEPTFMSGPVPAAPMAYFQEELVTSIGGVNSLSGGGSCSAKFSGSGVIPILNPDTGVPTGSTVTHAELYAILFSLYMQTAMERDSAAP